jgi:Na+-transporting methylmalonyl-CoA/oxaloacetate decarboxylase gamma subunit
MFAQAIVYVILSILSATAIYAMGKPIGKSSEEQSQLDGEQAKDVNSL